MGNSGLNEDEIKYTLDLTKEAFSDLSKIKKYGISSDKKKIEKIFEELENHPIEGIGQPEQQLKGTEGSVWSRRLNKKDRVVFQIFEDKKIVVIYQLLGHYEDR